MIEDDPSIPLHLLYMKTSNNRNPRNIQSFITKMKKKQLTDDKIIELISSRFGIKKNQSREELSDWERVFQGQIKRKLRDDNDISIIIQKVLDHIKISVMGVTCYQELHEIIRTISFIMGIYKQKKVDKRKDLPDNISNLFRKSSKKDISFYETPITSQEDIDFEPEPEPEPKLEPEPEPVSTIQLKTDEEEQDKSDGSDDDDDDDDDDESDDESYDESYGRISSSEESQSGGGRKSQITEGDDLEDESKYPNRRYYIKRLEERDPKLFIYEPIYYM